MAWVGLADAATAAARAEVGMLLIIASNPKTVYTFSEPKIAFDTLFISF